MFAPSPPAQRNAAVFVISITPFDRAGKLDEAGFRAHLRRMAEAGIGVYVGGGGSGEGYTLSDAEMKRVVEIAVSELKGKVPVRAMGKEPRTAKEMIDFALMAKDAGADAIQIYSLDVGHGHAPTPEEIDGYFSEVLTAVKHPVVISTHQSVGYRISADVISNLVKRYDHVIGVNCSHQDLGYLAAIIDGAHGKPVLVGGPMQGPVNLALGGHGYLCSEGNLAPKLCVSAIQHYKCGDLAAAMDAFGKIVRLSQTLYGAGGIRMTKAVLGSMGLPGGYPRKPRLPVAEDKLAQVLIVVRSLAIPELPS
ncbi:MAG: dihydrodipicolinate synthase family protein [Rhodospirillaceae bacterium]|nr:dihydrodipicolinate synthase family protein [Rhodospirillaceae bacterium]